MFDAKIWAGVPFHFWSLVLFVFGTIVGSFLNVCIHRMPRGESLVSPPSHCPHCGQAIPWYLNIPLLSWLILRGRRLKCRAPIHIRYWLVELVTGLSFLFCWLQFGREAPGLALAYCALLAGFITASCIDFEHFIIPDEITIGGMVAGFLCSLAVPALHQSVVRSVSLRESLLGMAVGGGIVYAILRLGKLLFGRHPITLPPGTRVVFTESNLQLPDREIPYEELFYRQSDSIQLDAKSAKLQLRDLSGVLPERELQNVALRLSPDRLQIEQENFNPEEVVHLEVVTNQIVLPREAMGLGDVKFMAAIGSFLGWQAALFSLMVSAVIGSLVGIALIVLRKQQWSSRLPYGPYIAVAATFWIFGGQELTRWWFQR